jgi:thiol-disulfide isomerase/thioredoxin
MDVSGFLTGLRRHLANVTESNTNHRADSAQRWLWPILCIVLAGTVLYLSYQNLQLKRQLASLDEYYLVPKEMSRLDPGSSAPPFEVYLPDGQSFVMRTDSLAAPLLLAWLSSDCEPCLAAREHWNELAQAYPGQFWGVTKDPFGHLDSAFSSAAVDFPILTPASDSIFALYRIKATPITMLVQQDGTVGGVWHGPLTTNALTAITDMMGPSYSERR